MARTTQLKVLKKAREKVAPLCPACETKRLNAEPARNACSRYADCIYICPPCGVREATELFFWETKYRRSFGLIRKSQQGWNPLLKG